MTTPECSYVVNTAIHQVSLSLTKNLVAVEQSC